MSRRDEVIAIVRQHTDFVWRSLRFLGVRERDLDDACQEVFIVVCRKLPEFEERSSLKTWLRGICVKTAAAHRRRAHVRHETPVALHKEELALGTPEIDLENERRLALLQRALDALDDDRREVFVLYEIEQMTMKEVAEVLGCKLQTAYSRYHSAKEQVTAFVQRESGDD